MILKIFYFIHLHIWIKALDSHAYIPILALSVPCYSTSLCAIIYLNYKRMGVFMTKLINAVVGIVHQLLFYVYILLAE